MKISRIKLANIIIEKINDPKDPKKLARQIAAYLLISRRTNDLESLKRDIIGLRADQGIIEIEVESAFRLSMEDQLKIKKLIFDVEGKMKDLLVKNIINTDLIGGFKINFASRKELDLTVQKKINQFKYITNRGNI
ncbi:MAG: F0F1 ATP synthase subunit delta [Patescibacteria group bacterium]|jgi:F0F1-type ATP synthase delta subunit|nr:F0F1 ATP synthase subunit delta [Patescibacteria group bacterium]